MKQFNAHDFKNLYEKLGIEIPKLGCVMLDLDGSKIKKYRPYSDLLKDEDIYVVSDNPDRFFIKGYVGDVTPHVTLLYGLLQNFYKSEVEYKAAITSVLHDISVPSVRVEKIGYFESPYPDEPYYCIVAHLEISDELKYARGKAELLPHINTFPDFKAHVTLAYVVKDELLRDQMISFYSMELQNKILFVKKLNYGKWRRGDEKRD